jgi:hypothetical protein
MVSPDSIVEVALLATPPKLVAQTVAVLALAPKVRGVEAVLPKAYRNSDAAAPLRYSMKLPVPPYVLVPTVIVAVVAPRKDSVKDP